jgi:hypothetical protein
MGALSVSSQTPRGRWLQTTTGMPSRVNTTGTYHNGFQEISGLQTETGATFLGFLIVRMFLYPSLRYSSCRV